MRRFAPHAVVPLLLGMVLVLGTCDDQPTIPEADAPAAEISDAFHGEGGNPHFMWLPPMVPQPPTFNGPFDGDSDPVVSICEFTDPGCTPLVHGATGAEAVYTVSGGPGGVVVHVDPVDEHFIVTWHMDEFNTSVGPTYRIQVTLGATLLGLADVTLTDNQKEVTKKNEITGETETITLKDGRTLPVTFRVEEGAICDNPTQPCTTATVESGEEKTVTLTDEEGQVFSEARFPSGWQANDENGDPVEKLTLTMEKRPVLQPADPEEDASCFQVVKVNDPGTGEPENCVELRADTDTESDVEVTFVRTDDGFLPVLTFCPDADVLASPNLDRYVMMSVEDDVPGQERRTYPDVAGLDCTGSENVSFGEGPGEGLLAMGERLLSSAASLLLPEKLWAIDGGFGGELDGLSTIFFFAIEKEAEVLTEPTVTEAPVGTDLGTVEVKVSSTHHDTQPLEGEEVTFSFLRPEFPVGTFDQPVVVTGVDGIAAHNWTLGAAGGRNTLFVFGEASDTARLEVLGLGRVSLWKGDGDNADAVGQNHGTRANPDANESTQVTPFAPGIVDEGQAFDFDGTGDVVTFPARNIRDAPDLTVATWVYLDPDGPVDEIQRFVTIGGARAVLRQNNPPPGGARQLHFYMNIDDEEDGVFDTDGTDLHHITVNNALATGCWHHVAGTYDGTTMRLYLDGIQVGNLGVAGEQWPNAGAVRLSHVADPGDGVPHNEALYGRLDEVEVHNVALSGTEIGAMHNNHAGHPDVCGNATPAARLQLQSEEDDFIGQGGTFDITYSPTDPGFFSPQIRRTVGPDDLPAELLFVMGSSTDGTGPDNTRANVFFGTDALGIPIQPGTYLDAERADFASQGHPGLDVTFQGRGCNTLTGEFTIDHVTFFRGPDGTEIETFSGSFEQHCEGAEPALFGTFVYSVHGDLPDVPALPDFPITAAVPSTVAAGSGQLLVLQGGPFPTTPRAFVHQDGAGTEVFVFQSPTTTSEVYVRLMEEGATQPAAEPGSAAVQVTDADLTVQSDLELITVSTTPGAPVLRDVFPSTEPPSTGTCGTFSTTSATQIGPGDWIAIQAWGTDTSGAEVLFTQDGVTTAVPVSCTQSSDARGLLSVVQVPSSVTVGSDVAMTIRVEVNDLTGPESNGVTLATAG